MARCGDQRCGQSRCDLKLGHDINPISDHKEVREQEEVLGFALEAEAAHLPRENIQVASTNKQPSTLYFPAEHEVFSSRSAGKLRVGAPAYNQMPPCRTIVHCSLSNTKRSQ